MQSTYTSPRTSPRCGGGAFLIIGAEYSKVEQVFHTLTKVCDHWEGCLAEVEDVNQQQEDRGVHMKESAVVEDYILSIDEDAKMMSVGELKELESQLKKLKVMLYDSVKGVRQLREEKVERERQEEAEQRLCCVCLERVKDMALMPCQHMCVCRMCGAELSKCPLCRAHIRKRLPLYPWLPASLKAVSWSVKRC